MNSIRFILPIRSLHDSFTPIDRSRQDWTTVGSGAIIGESFAKKMKRFLHRLQDPRFAHTVFLWCLVPAVVLSALSCFLAIRVNEVEVITLSSYVLATVGLLSLVPSTRRSMPFRLPVLFGMVGLSALRCVVQHNAVNLGIIVLAIAFMLTPPNDPPGNSRQGDKVKREQLRWSPDLEAAV